MYTGTLSNPCWHVIETREWLTNGRVPDCHVWRHRDKGYTPGSCAYVFAVRMPVPHLEAFPDYMQSVSELSATVYESITFTSAAPVCRPTPCAALMSSSGAIRLVPTPYQMKNSPYSLMKAFTPWPEWQTWLWWDSMCLLGQRPNPSGTLGELREALPKVWQYILRTFHPNLIALMRRQCCMRKW